MIDSIQENEVAACLEAGKIVTNCNKEAII